MKAQDVIDGVERSGNEGSEAPARVIEVLDTFNLVIDRGRNLGVERGDVYEVYRPESNSMPDKSTPELMGETIKGLGEVIAVYKKTASLRSITPAFIVERPSPIPGYLGGPLLEVVDGESGRIAPFEDPRIGDLARPDPEIG